MSLNYKSITSTMVTGALLIGSIVETTKTEETRKNK